MKRITRMTVAFLAMLLLLVTGVGTAGASGYTPEPGSPIQRHNAGTAGGQHIDLEGDSITDGGVIPCVCNRLSTELSQILRIDPSRIIDNGSGGQLLTGHPGLADRWATHMAALQSGDLVIIDIGMNDLFTYPGDSVYFSTLHDIVVYALNAGMKVLITTITPVSSTHWNVETLREKINSWTASVFSDRFIDYSVLHDRQNGQAWGDPTMMMPDGIHPSEGGTRIMAQTAAAAMLASTWFVP